MGRETISIGAIHGIRGRGLLEPQNTVIHRDILGVLATWRETGDRVSLAKDAKFAKN